MPKIGEAAKRLPTTYRDAHPGIRWSAMTGTRDILAHGYDSVDIHRLWLAIPDSLIPLLADLERLRAEAE